MPTPESAQNWLAMIRAEHAQTERLRDHPNPHDDHWHGMTVSFRSDPHRTDDPLLDRLAREVQPHHTLIDVGSGPGRLALPLALRCKHVTAVEPSPAMAEAFREEAAAHNIKNVTLVESMWEDAEVGPAHVVLCSHVIYTARHVDQFVRKLAHHANAKVLVILHWDPPQHRAYRLWPDVHGETRLPLPAGPQLLEVLDEMGISYNVEDLPTPDFHGFQTSDEAWQQTRGMLFLTEGSEKDRLLRSTIKNHLEERNGQLYLKDSKPMRPVLITWPP